MSKKIVVIGSINMDLVYEVPEIVKEGQTIQTTDHHLFFGGKGANQAMTAAQLGAEVAFIGSVGEDGYGQQAVFNLESQHVDTSHIHQQGLTGQAIIQLSHTAENSILLYPGANFNVTPAHIEAAREVIEQSDMLLLQLEIPLPAIEHAIEVAYASNTQIFLNPAPSQRLSDEVLMKLDYLTPNRTELENLSGIPFDEHNLAEACEILINKGVNCVIVTLGKKGSYYFTRDGQQGYLSSNRMKPVDTTGAGDAFSGALAVALLHDSELEKAIHYASDVAGYVVTQKGAQPEIPLSYRYVKYYV